MGATSTIEWTESTWNPVQGCTKVSPGCDNCYAEKIVERFGGKGSFAVIKRNDAKLFLPFSWRRPRRVFVNSMSDLFHDAVPFSFIANVWSVMARTPKHTYQVLTKRHARMRSLLSRPSFRDNTLSLAKTDAWPLPNVWMGVSVEDQKWADIRVPALLATPAAVRWLSCEPLLGPVDLAPWLRPAPGCGFVIPDDGLCGHPRAATPECFNGSDCPITRNDYHGINWVVAGGESGTGARPMAPEWVREIRDHCALTSVPFFFKQAGAVLAKEWGCTDRKGHNPAEWPEPFPREYPTARAS